MKFKATILLCLVLVGAAGCSDDDNPTSVTSSQNEPVYFAMDVSILHGPDNPTVIRLGFSMELMDELPAVIANGKSIEGYYLDGASINGYLNLPLAATIDFSVSSGNKTISGTIDMPTRADEVSCNGVVLSEDMGNELDETDSYNFEWTGGNADYFVCFAGIAYGIPGSNDFWDETFSNSWTLVEESGWLSSFELIAANGSGVGPGSEPYVSSNWAKGYVTALAVPNRFWFSGSPPPGPTEIARPARNRISNRRHYSLNP